MYFAFEDKSKAIPETQKYAEEFETSVVIQFTEMLHQLVDNQNMVLPQSWMRLQSGMDSISKRLKRVWSRDLKMQRVAEIGK